MSKSISHIGLFVDAIHSMATGLRLTLKHFVRSVVVKRRAPVGIMDPAYFKQPDGIITNTYPFESIPVPDHGRYRLHNEVDDCIVCDLCVKICPVNCIDIEPIKSPVEIGKTSDGSTKRIYAATFDIDMAKCCYCGLCTTVCPTECLTMTKTYDFSEYDVRNMVYHFAELSPDQAVAKKAEMEIFTAEEKAKKAATAVSKESSEDTSTAVTTPKPAFKPKVTIPSVKKPDVIVPENSEFVEKIESSEPQSNLTEEPEPKPAEAKPVFKPKVMIPAKKPVIPKPKEEGGEEKA